MALLVSNVPLPEDESKLAAAVARHLGLRAVRAVEVVRKSLDARAHPPTWRAAVRVEVDDEGAVNAPGVRPWTARDDVRYGRVDAPPPRVRAAGDTRVIVVGAGPAGLFAALWLAEAGVPVLLVDRGGPVEHRVPAVNGFWRRQLPLDADNNLLFGEGGAGTFSDGKIYTRRRDGDIGYILRRFVDCGARSDILEEGWAHLGTDKVRAVLPVLRARLGELGAEVRYHARVEHLLVEGGRAAGVVLASGVTERGSHVVFAPGHSARDTVRMLAAAGAAVEARPVAIGARIEHPQRMVDRARYGAEERGELPAASYRLAFNPRRGLPARTFCMCPGGMVVPAMNEPGQVVVNGMSFSAQRALWANSAVIVEAGIGVYGSTAPLAGYDWQDDIERRAFEAGGGDYTAPAVRVEDLLRGETSRELPRVSYPMGARPADLRAVLPEVVLAGMAEAVRYFGRKLPGFDGADAVLIAPETRTTSPVGFLRTPTLESTTLPGLYPVGEGAGFGGGIVSCALDGIRAARAIAGAIGAS